MSGKSSATSKNRLRILYDGWPLVRSPESPAAVHLYELISLLPEAVDASLALPGPFPVEFPQNPPELVIDPHPGQPDARFRWVQSSLPALARRAGAAAIHTTGCLLPLLPGVPTFASPCEEPAAGKPSLSRRAGEALGVAGLSRARAVFWPSDLPEPKADFPVHRLPAVVHPYFWQPQPAGPNLPEAYVYCPGPFHEGLLSRLVSAWEWVYSGAGDTCALVISHATEEDVRWLENSFQERGLAVPVLPVALPNLEQRASVLRHAAAVLFLNRALPWGDASLQALACGRPLVAEIDPPILSRVGPAGYLVSPGDTRAMGAALLSFLVDEGFQGQMARSAEDHSAGWNSQDFSSSLGLAYEQLTQS